LERIDSLKQAFEKKNFDAFLVSNGFNLLYLTGVPGTANLLIPKKGENTLFVYSVNYEQAKTETKNFKVEQVKRGENLIAKIAKQAKAFKIRKLGADALSHEVFRSLAKELRGQTKLKVENTLVWQLRRVKDQKEVALMRNAGELTSVGMKTAYETIRPGIKEIEVAAEIEYAMRRNGSWGTAFETSVASGARSAYPHGGCTDHEIRKGDLVVVDIGATYKGYCSDMTRTVVAGQPSAKQKKLHGIVQNAQENAYQTIKPKVKARNVDLAARKVIEEAGYGEFFVHGLGHGVGLEVHEPPTLSLASKDTLTIGNVVTNEPGIYLPGFGGVRIEDTVLVVPRKAEKLTVGTYSLGAE
jgi:Xaa-Pro aminopeptidase